MTNQTSFSLFPSIRVLLVATLFVLSGCISPATEKTETGGLSSKISDLHDDSSDSDQGKELSGEVDNASEGSSDADADSGADGKQEPDVQSQDQSSESQAAGEDSGPGDSGTQDDEESSSGGKDGSSSEEKSSSDEETGEGNKDEDDQDGGHDEGDKESGDEEKLPLWVEPSHGSAKVYAEGVNLTLEPSNMMGQSEFMVGGSVVLGFLESDREYRVEVDGHEVTFVTKESPYNWSEEALVHPGVEFQNSGCTLGFIFQDPLNETLYALTAAHCVSLGEQIYIDGVSVGKVVAHRHGEVNWDLALIRIYDRAKVSPSLPHFSGPTELAGHVPDGDTLCIYGTSKMAYPVGSVSFTGEDGGARCGYKIDDWPKNNFMMSGPGGYFGDSGSPVIHYESGTAYGILVAGYSGGYMRGNLICAAMDWLAEDGFDLILATYRYNPGPPQPLTESQGSQDIDMCY